MTTTISKQTKTTPNIILDNITNDLIIEGRSIPFESDQFWSFVIGKLKNYKLNTIRFKMEHINTNSIRHIPSLFNLNYSNIVWEYDSFDDDMFEIGQMFKKINNRNFNLVEIHCENLMLV